MIQVTNLTKVFRGETDVTALTGINLNVDDGDIYGIIGMSGAGKSTLLRCIALLETPTQGRIEVDGVDISTLQGKDLTALRKSVGVIFQGYNLLMQRNVLRNVCFPLELDGVKKEAREARAMELLNVVGLADKARAYPAQLSGGQKQRIAIARAIALRPALIVCDEPVSALDVSVQAQVVNLLQKMKAEYHITYLFISHDLRVVKHLSDRIAVMYLGAMMEYAGKQSLFEHPLHPYTQMLLSSVPDTDPERKREKIIMQGEIPGIDNIPQGCRFCTRCPYATERCRTEKPTLREVKPGHSVACFRYEEGKQA